MESISDILSSTYTDSELKHVISVLDRESDGNAAIHSHRSVHTLVETNLLKRAKNVLDQMQPLAQSVESLGRHVKHTSGIYEEMRSIVTANEAATAVFAENAQFLQTEIEALDKQSATIDSYMDAVHISTAEESILSDFSKELSPEFFRVFERVKRIRTEAAVLLLAEAPKSGEHLMQETSKLLDQAYLRIKSSILTELKQRRSSNSDTPATNLRKQMSLLADRPLLFKSVLQEQSGVRQDQLTREFSSFVALEQHNAHILPVRYLGSVLAWAHAAIVNEFEYIGLLLDPELPRNEESQVSEDHATKDPLEQLLSTSDTRKIITEFVDSVIVSIEPSLRQQINSVILAQTDPACVYELESVLLFYESLLAKFEQPTLNTLLEHLRANLERQFTHLLEAERLNWEDRVDIALALLKIHDTGVFSDAKFTQRGLDIVMDKALKEELHDATPIKALNILNLAISRLAGHVVAQAKLDGFRTFQLDFEAQQVAIEVRNLKKESKLVELQTGSISVREFMIAFDEFLSVAGIDLQTRLELIDSPNMQISIATSAVTEFSNEYEFAVKDIGNARAAEEVKNLLL